MRHSLSLNSVLKLDNMVASAPYVPVAFYHDGKDHKLCSFALTRQGTMRSKLLNKYGNACILQKGLVCDFNNWLKWAD